MAVRIVYETHSITTDNEAGLATGWLPGELSARGCREAAELGDRRRDDGIDLVLVSDLARARRTVEIAFAGTGPEVRVDARLRECDYGRLNGAPVDRLRPRIRYVDAPFPDGQSYRAVVDRTRELLRELAAGLDGRRVLFVAHSANRWALQHLLDGVRLEDLVDSDFGWQPGWEFEVPAGFR